MSLYRVEYRKWTTRICGLSICLPLYTWLLAPHGTPLTSETEITNALLQMINPKLRQYLSLALSYRLHREAVSVVEWVRAMTYNSLGSTQPALGKLFTSLCLSFPHPSVKWDIPYWFAFFLGGGCCCND